uniref:Uncharacterized protein LOC111102524 n=1 Tax=Crassostrea virginica TaxID=6565 RepID=A0A8B8AHN4_CRAVI|nr:uncharacterized protein LOC111102524 [Crassostrea virginica]
MTMVRSNGRPNSGDYYDMGYANVKPAFHETTQQRMPEPVPEYSNERNQETTHSEQVLDHVYDFGGSVYSTATGGYVDLLDVSVLDQKQCPPEPLPDCPIKDDQFSKSMKSDVFSIDDGPKYDYLEWNEKKNCTNCTNKKIAIYSICIIVLLGIVGTIAFIIATNQDKSTPERNIANNPSDVICQNGTVGTCVSGNDCSYLCDGDYQSCDLCSLYVSCLYGKIYPSRPCNRDATTRLVWDDNFKQCKIESSTCPNSTAI